MAKQNPEVSALQEQLADAQAQIEALQSAAADAEARAATAQAELAEAHQQASRLDEELATARAAEAESAEARGQLGEARDQLVETRSQLREATLKYREARLAAAPHIPADLVPGDTLEEIDQQLESAQRVVSHLREKLQQEGQSSRVPVGAPPRRPPDISGLSATEKIKLGLQQLGGP